MIEKKQTHQNKVSPYFENKPKMNNRLQRVRRK